MKWQTDFEFIHHPVNFNDRFYVQYRLLRSIWPLTQRQLFTCHSYQLINDKKTILIMVASPPDGVVVHDMFHTFFDPDKVTALCRYSAILMTPLGGNRTLAQRIYCSDAGGKIPRSVLNFTDKMNSKMLSNCLACIKKYEPIPQIHNTSEGSSDGPTAHIHGLDEDEILSAVPYMRPVKDVYKAASSGITIVDWRRYDSEFLGEEEHQQQQCKEKEGKEIDSESNNCSGTNESTMEKDIDEKNQNNFDHDASSPTSKTSFFIQSLPPLIWFIGKILLRQDGDRILIPRVAFYVSLFGISIYQSWRKEQSENVRKQHEKKNLISLENLLFITPYAIIIMATFPVMWWTKQQNKCYVFIPKEYNNTIYLLCILVQVLALCRCTLMLNILKHPATYPHDCSYSVGVCGHSGIGTGKVRCHFDINLKRVLDFLDDLQDKDQDNGTAPTIEQSKSPSTLSKAVEISVTHLVVKAIALSLSEHPSLNGRKVFLPMLLVRGYYLNKTVDINVVPGVQNRKSIRNNVTVRLANADKMSLEDIAHCVEHNCPVHNNEGGDKSGTNMKKLSLIESFIKFIDQKLLGAFGSCVVLSSPNSPFNEVKVGVKPLECYGAATMVVTVGGMSLITEKQQDDNEHEVLHPLISITITIDSPAADVATCRAFAEMVQSLVQNPEELQCR